MPQSWTRDRKYILLRRATDKNAAAQLYKNMQVAIVQQAPLTSLYNNNYQYAMLSGISGFRVDPAYPNVVFVHDLKP